MLFVQVDIVLNVDVNMYVYNPITPSIQQTLQLTPLVLELSLIWSHFLWGEFSAFSAANAVHNFPMFVPPGTHHCWVPNTSTYDQQWESNPSPTDLESSTLFTGPHAPMLFYQGLYKQHILLICFPAGL